MHVIAEEGSAKKIKTQEKNVKKQKNVCDHNEFVKKEAFYGYALASLFSFFALLSENISFSLPSRLCRLSRFCCWLANRVEPVGELFALLSFPRPGSENLRDALRVGVEGSEGAAVDVLAFLECPLTEGAAGAGSVAGATAGVGVGSAAVVGSTTGV